VRRSFGGLLLVISAVLFALALGLFWLDQVAFSPSDDSDTAYAILDDEDIRAQVATIIASADAPVLSQSPAQLKEFIEQIARIPDGAALMGRFLAAGHARVIGESDELVLVTAEEQVTIVRDERVGEEDPLTLPVQEVGSVSFVRTLLPWVALGAAAAGLVTLLGGIVLRPERGEGTFALAVGLGSLSISLITFGYLVPLFVLPALSDEAWMGVFARLAQHHRTTTMVFAVIAAALAIVIVVATGNRRQRRQHSTPLNVGRYREQRSWSR